MNYYIELILRMVLAIILGSLIGVERGRKGRAAGLRTHVLVCLGAALVVMTNEYIVGQNGGDAGRMAASVVSGIGFLGAGTIMVTGRHQIKGLTTAASLWACACLGIAVGAGFYIPALVGSLLIFGVNTVMHRVESKFRGNSKIMPVYIEVSEGKAVGRIINYAKEHEIDIRDVERFDEAGGSDATIGLYVTLVLTKKQNHEAVKKEIEELKGVNFIEFLHI